LLIIFTASPRTIFESSSKHVRNPDATICVHIGGATIT
jgi:hypothetical protein